MHGRLSLLILLLFQNPKPDACPPCGSDTDENIVSVRGRLQEAFRLSTTTANCSGEHLPICRSMESLLEQAYDALGVVLAAGTSKGSTDCVSCDPGPYVRPLFDTFQAVSNLLEARGHDEFRAKRRRMQKELEIWKGYRCCESKKPRAAGSGKNREMEARAALTRKCGSNFAKNRRDLRQVVRIPGDREGCYQSRACRDASEHKGQLMDAGFWTYDGESWYVWGERLTPRGDWAPCDPGDSRQTGARGRE